MFNNIYTQKTQSLFLFNLDNYKKIEQEKQIN